MHVNGPSIPLCFEPLSYKDITSTTKPKVLDVQGEEETPVDTSSQDV